MRRYTFLALCLSGLFILSCSEPEVKNEALINSLVGTYCGSQHMDAKFETVTPEATTIEISPFEQFDLVMYFPITNPSIVGIDVEGDQIVVPQLGTADQIDNQLVFTGVMWEDKELLLYNDKEYSVEGTYSDTTASLVVTETNEGIQLDFDMPANIANIPWIRGSFMAEDICNCGIDVITNSFYNEEIDSTHLLNGKVYITTDSLRIYWNNPATSGPNIPFGLALGKE